jgi:hypothetical protein
MASWTSTQGLEQHKSYQWKWQLSSMPDAISQEMNAPSTVRSSDRPHCPREAQLRCLCASMLCSICKTPTLQETMDSLHASLARRLVHSIGDHLCKYKAVRSPRFFNCINMGRYDSDDDDDDDDQSFYEAPSDRGRPEPKHKCQQYTASTFLRTCDVDKIFVAHEVTQPKVGAEIYIEFEK